MPRAGRRVKRGARGRELRPFRFPSRTPSNYLVFASGAPGYLSVRKEAPMRDEQRDQRIDPEERARAAHVVLRPADPLDLAEARRLVAAIAALPPAARVHLDVSALREVHPTGLALLGHALGGDDRVTMGGLSRRQERLLAYLLAEEVFGAVRSRAAPAAPGSAAEAPAG
jgi:hypothetical protein